jgi:hypothetical protein
MIGYYGYLRHLEPHMPAWLHKRAERLRRHFQQHDHLQGLLPAWLESRAREACERRVSRLSLWRVKPLPTRVLGHKWPRSHDRASIDITYSCNLRCYNCNRSCQQDPSDDGMSLDQVHHFLEESQARRVQWRLINVAGGEPTNHPQVLEIMNPTCARLPKCCSYVGAAPYRRRTSKAISEHIARSLGLRPYWWGNGD